MSASGNKKPIESSFVQNESCYNDVTLNRVKDVKQNDSEFTVIIRGGK